jgi:RNA ligase
MVVYGVDNWRDYGDVKVSEHANMLIFNYRSPKDWNFFERISRGLIINWETGEIVARPFDKFFNWGEGDRKGIGHMVSITDKVDGSLGILYRYNDEYRISTRGSFLSDQAEWATAWLQKNFSDLYVPEALTLLFEIVYPENKVVVDYEDYEGLILLAARNRFSGNYIPHHHLRSLSVELGFDLVSSTKFNSISDIITAAQGAPENVEGWVVEMSDGSRWKFKGEAYRELHKIVTQLSPKRILKAVSEGTIRELHDKVPPHLQEYVRNVWVDISDQYADVCLKIDDAWESIDADMMTRKQFALFVNENYSELSPYLFAMYDDNPNIDQIIYKREFKDWTYDEFR